MTPVVNGLETAFAGQVDIRSLDANSREGRPAFQSYALPGHPSYVIVDPQGEVLWSAFGPKSAADLREAIEAAILTVSAGY